MGKKEAPYPDCSFEFRISDERTYKTKGARRLGCVGFFFCEGARTKNHGQPFLLWMLYKGAYQNEDAPNYLLGGKVSQYVPQVHGPAPCHA